MFQDMTKKLNESIGPMKELVEIQTRMLEKLTRLQMECAQNCVKATMQQTQDLPACHSTEELIGHPLETIHIVGGGSQNQLLCQMAADACNRRVVAGPKPPVPSPK